MIGCHAEGVPRSWFSIGNWGTRFGHGELGGIVSGRGGILLDDASGSGCTGMGVGCLKVKRGPSLGTVGLLPCSEGTVEGSGDG